MKKKLETKKKIVVFLLSCFRALLCIIGYARNVLSEQKRSDFKPDTDLFITERSAVRWKLSNEEKSHSEHFLFLFRTKNQICKRIVRLIEEQISRIEQNLDGKNLIDVLNEFGLRFHRLITDHVFKFEYNISGYWKRRNHEFSSLNFELIFPFRSQVV